MKKLVLFLFTLVSLLGFSQNDNEIIRLSAANFSIYSDNTSLQETTINQLDKLNIEHDFLNTSAKNEAISLTSWNNFLPPTVEAPKQIEISSRSDSSVQLNWTLQANCVWEYIIQNQFAGYPKDDAKALRIITNSINIENLEAGTNYEIYVRSVTSQNGQIYKSSWSTPFAFNTTLVGCTSPQAGNTCDSATNICTSQELDGYCGTTSGSYAANHWPELNTAFCGTLENNSFLSFIAASSVINLDVEVGNCISGTGIQIMLFSAATCGSGPVNTINCYSPLNPGITTLNFTGLNVGQQYFLMIDGFANAICDYSFTLNNTGGQDFCSIDLGADEYYCNSNLNTTTLTAQSNIPPAASGTLSYNWYLDNVLQTTTATNTLTVSQSGEWTVEINFPWCCSVSTDSKIVVFSSEPTFNQPTPATINSCGPFDLTSLEAALVAPEDPATLTIRYYLSQTDAWSGNSNNISDPTNFYPSGGTQDVYINIMNAAGCSNGDAYVTFVCTCIMDLTSTVDTEFQTICLGDAITDITYQLGGDAINATISGLPTGLTGSLDTSTNIYTISGTPSVLGSFTGSISTVGCPTETVRPITINVSGPPVFNSLVPDSTPICEGEDALFNVTGSPYATLTYTVNSGTSQTTTLDGTGSVQITVSTPTSNVTLELVEMNIGSCITSVSGNSATVAVINTPAVTALVGNGPLCNGETIIYTVEGTPSTTFNYNYTIDGGTAISGSSFIDATGTGTVQIANATPGTYNLTLEDITLNGCTAALSNSYSVFVNVDPVINSITTNGPICPGQNATFIINGDPTTTLQYSINGGTTQTIGLNSSGTATITSFSPSSDVTLNLLTLSTISCIVNLTETATVAVTTPTLTSFTAQTTPICAGEDAIFDIEGTPNTTVYYTVNSGTSNNTSLDASGIGQITLTAVNANQTVTLSSISLGSCSTSLTNTATVVVNPSPQLTSLTGDGTICYGQNASFTIIGTPNAVLNYDLNSVSNSLTLDASGNATITLTNPAVDSYTLVLSDLTLNGCTISLSNTETINVISSPEITNFTTNSPICEGEDAEFYFEGSPNAVVNYTLNGNTASLTLDASGLYTLIETAPTTDVTVILQDIGVNNCTTTLTNSETVVVNTTPTLTSLGGTTPICAGEDAIFDIVGTPNATITYTLNGTTSTVVLDTVGSGTVTYTTTDDTDQVITLSDITLSSCSTTLTDTYTIVVNPIPTFTSLTTNSPICNGENAEIYFEGSPNATVNYTNNGSAAAVTLDSSGLYTLTVTNPSADVTIILQDIALNGCSLTLSNSETVTVNPTPTVSVTHNGPICEDQDAIFTLTGTPNTTVTYTLDNGSSTNTIQIPASGTNTITIAGATSDYTIDITNIVENTTLCAATLSLSATIINLPAPTATMATASNLVCLNGTTTLTFTGTAGATVHFTDGTTTYDLTIGTGGTIDFTTPMLTADTTYTLTGVTSASTPACTVTLSESETIAISPTPEITSSTFTDTICDGTLTDIVVQLNNATGLQWQATLSNVYFGDPSVSNGDQDDINQTVQLINPLVEGNITMQILPVLVGGNCVGEYQTIVINVNPVPSVTEIVPSVTSICDGESVSFTVSGNPGGVSFQWTAILDGVVTQDGVVSGSTEDTITLDLDLTNASQAGEFYIEVTPILEGCTGDAVVSDTISVNPIPGAVVSSPSYPICSGESASAAFNISLGFPLITGTTVEWEVYDASGVTGYSSGSSSTTPFEIPDVLTTTGTTQGYVIYRIWTISEAGCQGSYTDFTVYVNPNPEPVLEDGSICVDESGTTFQSFWLLANGTFESNSEFEWYEVTETGDNFIAVTYDPQLEVSTAGTYYVMVTNQDTSCVGISNTATVIETYPATSITTEVSDAFSDSAAVIVTVPDGNGTLLYQMDEGDFQSDNIFTDVSAGEHTITVVDTEGCTYLTTTVMVVDYPRFFTPNGDGYNDTWGISGLNQTNARLYIFDRYGKLIKQLSATDNSEGWDGTFNGVQLPSTDYWFSLQYEEDGVAKEFKAHFSLKR